MMDLFSSQLTKGKCITPLVTTDGANTLSQSPLRHLLSAYCMDAGPVKNSKRGNYLYDCENNGAEMPCGDTDCEMCYDDDGVSRF